MTTTRALGHHTELLALDYLKQQGCLKITVNYNTRIGEIDIIVADSDVLVFVEVRYRRETTRGTGAETVTPQKMRKIIRTAQHFLITHKQYKNMPCRFDVISMSRSTSGSDDYSFDWIKRAFTLDT